MIAHVTQYLARKSVYMSADVVLKYCPEYSADLQSHLKNGIDEIGGIKRFVNPGQKVFLKVNLLMKKTPQEAVTTHPEVVEAVVRLVQEAGGVPIIGDSPGGPYTVKALRGIYNRSGLQDVAERTGAILNENVEQVTVSYPEGKVIKSLTVTKSILNADVIIPISKLKTHAMMTFTGAVKVLFGIVPGMIKAEYHLKLANVDDFANLLVDICEWAKPTIHIMDGIVGMEGDGPSSGKPRHIGALLISQDPYALDVAACSLIGLKPHYVPTIKAAQQRGFISSTEEIIYRGDSRSIWNIKNFTLPRSMAVNFLDHLPIPESFNRLLVKQLRPFPVFSEEMCVSCGDCLGHCPPKAIVFDQKKKPQVDLQSCIRCFCCQELCPKKAVNISKPLIGRLLFR